MEGCFGQKELGISYEFAGQGMRDPLRKRGDCGTKQVFELHLYQFDY